MYEYNLQKMVDEGQPIYVVNKSATVPQMQGKTHVLVIEFPGEGGARGSTVTIPAIKYPINLTRRVAPPSAIPKSRALVNWLDMGVLEIVPPKKARQVLEDPAAQAAIKRAYSKLSQKRGGALAAQEQNKDFKVKHGGARETRAYADLDEAGLTSKDFYGNTPEEAHPEIEIATPQEALRVSAADTQISAKIVKFCQDLIEDPDLKKDHLIDLKSWEEESLSDDEVGYMLEHLGGFDTISSYLKKLLAKRSGASAKPTSRKKGRKSARKAKSQEEDEEQDSWSSEGMDDWLEE